ncbi:F-box/kelch-repeat protein At3g23880 [Beta vulgaris subsp. vulgaris]|uniref:F-box/kelch-repeat protein At3g23880 n=1 Tax=Beta vulgaris subsp. vulgaris TaxID=3555 RepID=UPI002036A315|nr:F-box/kelch-repeat protein At3g23880 [Beta vulgaris subsp. vulgaris]XP_048494006.1 F-box/kelch-repeat protein At3g23880 [Beta vulgaris subsp. vulgaris]
MEENCILPDDLLQHILSRLPVRDLLRGRCVSKDWCALIDSPSFIRKHYQVQTSICKADGNMPHFVNQVGQKLGRVVSFHLLSIHQGDVSTLDLDEDIARDSNDMLSCGHDYDEQYFASCNGCVNGVILLTLKDNDRDRKRDCFGLWNPATREFKSLAYPNVRNCFEVVGFGFDVLSSDFKILGAYEIFNPEPVTYYEVYSLRTSAWKPLGAPPIGRITLPVTDAYLNGVFYWSTVPEYGSGRLVSFNFSSEIFKESDIPEDAKSRIRYDFEIMIALYKESIALFMSHEVQGKAAICKNVDVWVVTGFDDCGIPLSWQHLFTVGPTPANFRLDVLTTRVDGDLLLVYVYEGTDNSHNTHHVELDREEYLYNPSTAEFKYFGIGNWATYYRYAESLFPLSRRLIQS